MLLKSLLRDHSKRQQMKSLEVNNVQKTRMLMHYAIRLQEVEIQPDVSDLPVLLPALNTDISIGLSLLLQIHTNGPYGLIVDRRSLGFLCHCLENPANHGNTATDP